MAATVADIDADPVIAAPGDDVETVVHRLPRHERPASRRSTSAAASTLTAEE